MKTRSEKQRLSFSQVKLLCEFHENVEAHYLKAVGKHPKFCDIVANRSTVENAVKDLPDLRRLLRETEAKGQEEGTAVLLCELAEVLEAYGRGDYKEAISELFDLVAVAVRLFEVLRSKAVAQK